MECCAVPQQRDFASFVQKTVKSRINTQVCVFSLKHEITCAQDEMMAPFSLN
jgi:hypothetical protein